MQIHMHAYIYTYICIYTYVYNLQRMCRRCVRWCQRNICITHTAAHALVPRTPVPKCTQHSLQKNEHIYIPTHMCIRIHMHKNTFTHIQHIHMHTHKHAWNDSAAATARGAHIDAGSSARLFRSTQSTTFSTSNARISLYPLPEIPIPQRCSRAAVGEHAGIQAREWPRWLFTRNERSMKNDQTLQEPIKQSRQRGAQTTLASAHLHWCRADPPSSWPTHVAVTTTIPRNEITFV